MRFAAVLAWSIAASAFEQSLGIEAESHGDSTGIIPQLIG